MIASQNVYDSENEGIKLMMRYSQKPYSRQAVAGVVTLLIVLIGVCLLIYLRGQAPIPPNTKMAATQAWLLSAEPSGPKFSASTQFSNVYKIFANMPTEQRKLLLDGQTVEIQKLPSASQVYIKKFVQHASHTQQSVSLAGGVIKVNSDTGTSGIKMEVDVQVANADYTFTILG